MTSTQGQQSISQTLASYGKTLDQAIAYMIETQQKYERRLQDLEESVSQNQTVMEQEQPEEQEKAVSISNQGSGRGNNDSIVPPLQDTSFSALRMRFLRRRKCEIWCDCACHKRIRTRSPQMLQSIVGSIFVGYVGLPMLTPPCTNLKCIRTSESFVQVNYYFPQWFLARVVSVAMRCYDINDLRKSDFSVRTLNIRSRYEGIFKLSDDGDANAVKYLLTNKKASILDVTDDSGHSPLHVCPSTPCYWRR